MRINKIDILSVPVTDQQVSKKFYMDVLGFELVRENAMGPNRTWIELTPRGAQTSITLVNWFDNMPAGTLRGMVIETDDLEGAHGNIRFQGVEISEIDKEPWGAYATFSDPDGNGWVLQQALKMSSS